MIIAYILSTTSLSDIKMCKYRQARARMHTHNGIDIHMYNCINLSLYHRSQEIFQNLKAAFGQVHFADIWFAVINTDKRIDCGFEYYNTGMGQSTFEST